MDSSDAAGILLVIAAVFADFILNGTDAALRALHEDDLADDSLFPGSFGKYVISRLRNFMNDPDSYHESVNMACLCIYLLTGVIIGKRPVLLIIGVILIEVLGVRMPRQLALRSPLAFVQHFGRPAALLVLVMYPLVKVSREILQLVLMVGGVSGPVREEDVTEEEILSIVNEGHEQGVIEQSEAEMISNIFAFSEKEAANVMTHRNDMVALNASMTLQDAVRYMLQMHNSRFPVYDGNIDNIIGVVHLRDAVRYREDHPQMLTATLKSCTDMLREACFVPETKDIDDLFHQMQKQKLQIVIVIDEYGQTSGLITIEDLLEEIVGNIMDEYDEDESHITATGNKNEFIIEGRTPLEELTRRFGIRFEDDRFETVNGFLMTRMDRVPTANDHYVTEYEGFRFRILSVEDRTVQRVLLTRLQSA